MDDKNIMNQAKSDIFIELRKVIDNYNRKGASFLSLKKYFKKNKNFDEILEDIKNKSNHIFEDDKKYKIFVKEILMDLIDDKIAYEKDNKKIKMEHLKTFESYFKKIKIE